MVQLGQILFILSVLVILHEFGHYIAARIFKVRSEKFYLFMDVYFSIFAMKKINGKWQYKFFKKNDPDTIKVVENSKTIETPIDINSLPEDDWRRHKNSTQWGLGWLPMGGYVKLAGMIDESMDKEQLNQPVQEYEFRAKPAWQRLIIMLGGIIVNLVLAIFIYVMFFTTSGQKVISADKIQENGLAFGEVGYKAGFKSGDKIVSVDGKKFKDYKFVPMAVLFGEKVTINRDGKEIVLELSDEQIGNIIKKEGKGFVGPRFPIQEVYLDSIGKSNFGIKRFDEIIGINDKKFIFADELYYFLRNAKEEDSVKLLISRNGQELLIKTTIDSTEKRGISLKGLKIAPNFNMSETTVNDILNDSGADKSGIKVNDKILDVNNIKVNTYKDFSSQITSNKTNKEFDLLVKRDNKEVELKGTVDKNGVFGVYFKDFSKNKYEQKYKLTIGKAIPEAISLTWEMFKYNINSFKLILRPKTGAYTQIKSPIGIARQLPNEWDWEFVWNFVAIFSIGLAFMNLLPIPGLDGGHALFTIAEMITGKTLNEKAMEYLQTAGMVFLLTMMALVFGKDIYQWIMGV